MTSMKLIEVLVEAQAVEICAKYVERDKSDRIERPYGLLSASA